MCRRVGGEVNFYTEIKNKARISGTVRRRCGEANVAQASCLWQTKWTRFQQLCIDASMAQLPCGDKAADSTAND